MTRNEIVAQLLDKGFHGVLDRLNTGRINIEQAEYELLGGRPDLKVKGPLPAGVCGRSWGEIEKMQGGRLKR